jgi:histidinol-phosphate aminotransferase
MNINEIIRPNIRNLKAYSSARSLNMQQDAILLDANENPFSTNGRYPDPNQTELRTELSKYYGIPAASIMPGNGSDELIDLLFRAFTEPGESNIILPDPTYGMYEVSANIQNCEIRKVLLNDDFSLNADTVLAATDTKTRIIFICSPNNPTGNEFDRLEIEKVLKSFNGIVVLDQAYADFSEKTKWRNRINEFSNLAVLQTFSKAWGMAALRVGILFTNPEIINILMRIKLPYNMNELTQKAVIDALKNQSQVLNWLQFIKTERTRLIEVLEDLYMVREVFPTDANYVLARFSDANLAYNKLKEKGIIVRNRSQQSLCENTLRISIGTPEENNILFEELKEIDNNLKSE